MSATAEIEYRDYLRLDMMPHMLCPGCGHGIVLKAVLRAIDRLALPRDRVAFVAGIGCSSRIVGYVDFCTLHTTHGRPLTFATGLKLARPELQVIVVTGDGDGLAIGGNHLIHAARRNVDLTCLLLNNAIYGMTGGQAAPTTPDGANSTTTPAGAREPSFDACRLVQAAGATFVARGMTAAPLDLEELYTQALQHPGFAFVETISDCPEFFGRYNRLGQGPEMLQEQRRQVEWVEQPLAQKRLVPVLQPAPRPLAAHPTLPLGVLHRETRPELSDQLQALIAAERPTHVGQGPAGPGTGGTRTPGGGKNAREALGGGLT